LVSDRHPETTSGQTSSSISHLLEKPKEELAEAIMGFVTCGIVMFGCNRGFGEGSNADIIETELKKIPGSHLVQAPGGTGHCSLLAGLSADVIKTGTCLPMSNGPDRETFLPRQVIISLQSITFFIQEGEPLVLCQTS
jgi:hypothetical protein